MSVWLLVWFLSVPSVLGGAGMAMPFLSVTQMPDVATCRALVAALQQRGVRGECVEMLHQ